MREDVLRLHFEGLGQAAIARRLGIVPEAARAHLIAAGIARPAHVTRQDMAGTRRDPKRADRLLRSFS